MKSFADIGRALPEKKGPKHTHNWHLMAEEVSNYFGKPLYWLFHKFPDYEIMAVYKDQKERGEVNVQKLIAYLNAWKKRQSAQGETHGGNETAL